MITSNQPQALLRHWKKSRMWLILHPRRNAIAEVICRELNTTAANDSINKIACISYLY